MDNFYSTLRSLLRGIWDFVLDSIRIILFTICLLLFIFQLVWLGLVISVKNRAGLSLPKGDLDIVAFLQPLVLMFVGLFGCWAYFFKKRKALKWAYKTLYFLTARETNQFAFSATICATVLFIMVSFTMSLPSKAEPNTLYSEGLKENAKYYDWKRDGKADERSVKATEIWDSLQSLYCCGLNGANDWDEYRPKNIDKKYLPPSCCFPELVDKDSGLCSSSKEFWLNGCAGQIGTLEAIYLMFSLVFTVTLVVLSLLTCIFVAGYY